MTDIYGGIMDGLQLARTGADQHKQRGLASLVGKAYSAPQQQRGGLLAQIAGIDPAMAKQTQSSLGDWDDSRQEALVRSAKMLLTAPEEARPQVWAQIVQAGEIPGLQPTYDPVKVPEMAQRIVQQFGGAGSTAEQQNFAAMSAQFTPQQIQEARLIQAGLKPRAGLLQVGEYAGGIYGVNRDPSGPNAIPVRIGGQQPQMQYSADDGQPIPQDEMAAFRAAVAADARGEEFNIPVGGQLPPPLNYQGGGQLQAAPKAPPAPSEFERRIQAARQMGVSEDEIRRMVVGREGAAAGAKPMPAAALRMVTDANAALKEVETVNSTLQRIREEIASDKLNLGPIRNVINRGRVAAGLGNDESTRLSTTERSLRGLQNAALRLNKGVQTEGDAKRIWQELLGNLNDEASVLANIDRLMELNQRAQELHEMNLETVNGNYGRQQQDVPRNNAVNSGGWSIKVKP